MNNIQDMAQEWALQKEQYQQSIMLNTQALKQVKLLKAELKMRSFLALNIFTVVTGILMICFAANFAYLNLEKVHMVLAGGVILIWSCFIAFGGSRHLYLQLNLDYSKSVIEVQHQLSEISLSVLYYLRVSLLLLPFYFAFILIGGDLIWGIDLMEHGDTNWLISQAVFSLFFGALAIYLFKQLSPDNIDKPFTQLLLKGCGNQAWLAAKDLNELQQYDK